MRHLINIITFIRDMIVGVALVVGMVVADLWCKTFYKD